VDWAPLFALENELNSHDGEVYRTGTNQGCGFNPDPDTDPDPAF
jgi:hypothetical protein